LSRRGRTRGRGPDNPRGSCLLIALLTAPVLATCVIRRKADDTSSRDSPGASLHKQRRISAIGGGSVDAAAGYCM